MPTLQSRKSPTTTQPVPHTWQRQLFVPPALASASRAPAGSACFAAKPRPVGNKTSVCQKRGGILGYLFFVSHQSFSHLFGAERAVRCGDAWSGRLLEGRHQRVVLQIKPLEVLQLSEADREVGQFVAVQVQVAQVPQLAKVLGQLSQVVLAQVQANDVSQRREGILRMNMGKIYCKKRKTTFNRRGRSK